MNEKDKEAILEIENKIHRLKYGLYLIGRNEENIEHDIPINDESVDIKHTILEISPNEVKLTDLFTKNGTYINDTRLQKGKQQKLNITLTSSLSSCIKFGNVIGNFRFSSKEDSGYDDYESNNSLLHKNHHNLSDTIPPSPERSISQNTVYSRLKKKMIYFQKKQQQLLLPLLPTIITVQNY